MLRDTTSRGLYVRVWPPHTESTANSRSNQDGAVRSTGANLQIRGREFAVDSRNKLCLRNNKQTLLTESYSLLLTCW